MWRTIILSVLLIAGRVLFPAFIFAGGKCELTIENNTGTHINRIILEQEGSKKEPEIFYRNLEQNASTTIKIKKDTLYDIVLVDVNERQYVKRRQAWDDGEGNISFHRRDIQDRNFVDKVKRVILWPKYL